MSGEITKTQRRLLLYHTFWFSYEVLMEDLERSLPGCRKTILRDIALLRDIGVQIVYSRKVKSYSLASRKLSAPKPPTSEPGRLYQSKLIRLITIMTDSDYDIVEWYKRTYPDLSLRTMQRDFALLNSIGYIIKYNREMDWGTEKPVNAYECEWPGDLDTAFYECYRRSH
jgi:biotin operon repressor